MNLSDVASAQSRRDAHGSASYYGQPALKSPPWKWEVACYLFTSALAGASQLLGALAQRFGGPRMTHVVRNARYIAAGGALAGGALLISDLKTPRRWYNMLRILRPTSPMSIGSYILSAFGLSSLLTALQESRAIAPGAATTLQVPAAVAGIGMMTYTAPLLSSTSAPYWSMDPELRAAKYASSAIALAASTLSLLEHGAHRSDSGRTLERLAFASVSVQTLVSAALSGTSSRATAKIAATAPRDTTMHAAASMLTTVVPLCCYVLGRLAPLRARQLSIAASLSVIGGVALSKWTELSLGKHSTENPELYLSLAQPRNEKAVEGTAR
jgi:protein NrfD